MWEVGVSGEQMCITSMLCLYLCTGYVFVKTNYSGIS